MADMVREYDEATATPVEKLTMARTHLHMACELMRAAGANQALRVIRAAGPELTKALKRERRIEKLGGRQACVTE